jgi:hypothetical protein
MYKLVTTLLGLGSPELRGRMSSPFESLGRISAVMRGFFFGHSRQMPGYCLKLGHYPFKFMRPPCHSAPYYLSYWHHHQLNYAYGHLSLNYAARCYFNYLLAGRDLDGGCLHVFWSGILLKGLTETTQRNLSQVIRPRFEMAVSLIHKIHVLLEF